MPLLIWPGLVLAGLLYIPLVSCQFCQGHRVAGPCASIIQQATPGLFAWGQQVSQKELGSVRLSWGQGSELAQHFLYWSKHITGPAHIQREVKERPFDGRCHKVTLKEAWSSGGNTWHQFSKPHQPIGCYGQEGNWMAVVLRFLTFSLFASELNDNQRGCLLI